MDIDQMREFAAELVEVDKAESRTAARNRSERAAGIVKLWTSSPTIAPIAGTVGCLQRGERVRRPPGWRFRLRDQLTVFLAGG